MGVLKVQPLEKSLEHIQAEENFESQLSRNEVSQITDILLIFQSTIYSMATGEVVR